MTETSDQPKPMKPSDKIWLWCFLLAGAPLFIWYIWNGGVWWFGLIVSVIVTASLATGLMKFAADETIVDSNHNTAQVPVSRRDYIDVSRCVREGPYYVLDHFTEGADYRVGEHVHIWSIGKRHSDGKILASPTGDLYQNPSFECL